MAFLRDHHFNIKPGQMRGMIIALPTRRGTIQAIDRRPRGNSGIRAMLVAGGALMLGMASPSAHAQNVDCEQLRQQLASATTPDPNRDARFARAIQQQRSELARTQAYSDQIGCSGGLASLFGQTPPQCDSIADRVSRMQGNLDALESQARALRNGDPDRETDLAARYNAYCRGNAAEPDGTTVYTDPGAMPDDGSGIIDDQPSAEAKPQGGSKAICVRTCDGGFFPLGSSVRSSQLDDLQALCSAQCPNTEAKLYTTDDTDNISAAVALDGTPYTALPAAYKYQKSFDAACTCKPPNQSWVQALAQAEQLLDKSENNDVTVTEKMSADMSRPQAPAPPPAKKSSKRDRKTALPSPDPAIAQAADTALGAVGAQAPTASTASAGIAAGAGAATPIVKTDQGVVQTMKGPDGTKRQVRIIEPAL